MFTGIPSIAFPLESVITISDGVTIPSTAESYALALPVNSTEIAQAPTITNTITTIKKSSSQVKFSSTTTSIPTDNFDTLNRN